MTQTPSENPRANTVQLEENEFREVYSLMKMCLAAEMGLDPAQVPEGEPFIRSCRNILLSRTDDKDRLFDMSRGFVPLFERLNKAKDFPVKTGKGTFYHVEF